MTDSLELELFAVVLIAFVFVGCLATRARKKAPETSPAKRISPLDDARRVAATS